MTSTFVVGASGFIGSYLLNEFKKIGHQTDGSYFTSPEKNLVCLDITNKDMTRKVITDAAPEVICLPAANPNVEYCEVHPEDTYMVNVEGTRNVALAARETGAKLVYFSSDYVFDGRNGPYSETDQPNPISVYGRQKLESEQIITELLDDYIIARITVVYGWEKRGKNFVERLLQSLDEKKDIKVPVDQVGSPTYVVNLVEMVTALVVSGQRGIFNVCGPDLVNRYEFACSAAEVFGKNSAYIIPVTTQELGQKAPRPLRAGMKLEKIMSVINLAPMGINEGLRSMKEKRIC